MSTKKSNFTQAVAIQSTDSFDFTRGGTNLKIPFSAFSAALGVTGTIAPIGSNLAIPLLQQTSSSVNLIRGIEASNGIIAALSAQNGLSLKQNFTYNKTGEPLIVDETIASPVFKSLVAKDNMTITTVGNTIEFAASASLGTDVVNVSSEADFPTAVSGVITLLANKVYVINKSFTISNRLVLSSNTSLFGWNIFGPLLTYSGTGTMLTAVDASVAITDVHVTAPNGKVFDFSSTTGFHIASIRNINIDACTAIGTFTGLLALAINNILCLSAAQGMNFAGTGWNLISIIDPGIISSSASFVAFDLGTCVAENIAVKGGQITGPSGAIGIKGAASDANLTATGLGEIAQMSFISDITEISGIDISTDLQWESTANQGIVETHPDSLSSNTAGVTVTISGVNTPTLIAGTWVDAASQQFTVSGSGRVTYNGLKDMSAPVTLTITADPASGSAKDFRVYIALNGTEITASGVPARASASDREPVTVIWQHNFSTNDYIEAFISNETDAVDFDVIHAVLRIN